MNTIITAPTYEDNLDLGNIIHKVRKRNYKNFGLVDRFNEHFASVYLSRSSESCNLQNALRD